MLQMMAHSGQQHVNSPLSPVLSRRIPSFWTISLLVAIFFCIFVSEQGAQAEAHIENWFNREARAPRPKFIRFGRANGGQKFIRFGKSAPDYDASAENLDDLIDAVEELYPSQQHQQQPLISTDHQPTLRWPTLMPKRAQKFIRFG